MKLLQRLLICLFAVTLAAFAGLQYYNHSMVDKTPPVISFSPALLEVSANAPEESLLEGVSAADETDGDLTAQVMIQGSTQLLTEDTVKVSYIVFDSSNNIATASRTVRYLNYEKPRFSLTAPLTYVRGETIQILERLHATDVKDGDISSGIRVSLSDLATDANSVSTITAQIINSLGDAELISLPVVILENRDTVPTFELSDYILYLNVGASYSPARYIQNAANPSAIQISGTVDTHTPGNYHVGFSLRTPTERPDVYQTYIVFQTVVVR